MVDTDAPATLLQLLAEGAAQGHVALRVDDGHNSADEWSGAELLARAAGAADWLDVHGAPAGRPVAALVTGTADAITLAVGAAASHRPLAPLGPRSTVSEIAACLEPLAPSLIVADATTADLAHAAGASYGIPVVSIERFALSRRRIDLDPAPDLPAYILHTSGTTGRPKQVVCSQRRVGARILLYRRLLELGPGAVYATASPFHHTAGLGMALAAIGNGAAVQPFPRFSGDAWDAIIRCGITHALLVPAMIEQLLREGRLRAGTLRSLNYGASSISPQTLQQLVTVLPDVEISQIFGQTEGSPITCLTGADHRRIVEGELHLRESQGRAPDGITIVIANPGPDRVGEVWARAAHFFKPDADGWLRTGDLGRLDDDGYLYLCGRKDDMIVRGGENLYPEEVERVVREHPDVIDVAVIGVADQLMGERVAAVVVPRDGAHPPDPDDLRRFTRSRLAGFKVPERWSFRDELPRNAAGKVLRRLLINEPGESA